MAAIRSHIGAGNFKERLTKPADYPQDRGRDIVMMCERPSPRQLCLSISTPDPQTRRFDSGQRRYGKLGFEERLPLALPGANSQSCGDASLIGWYTVQGFIRHRPDWPGMTGTSELAFCLLQSIRCCSMWSMACLSKDALTRRNSPNSPFWNSSCCRFALIQRRSSMNIAILCSWMKVLARFSAQKSAQYALRLTEYWPRNPSKRIMSIQFSKSLTKSFGGPY